ncbi:hypothetical protein B0H12DRAFT_334463 [Mycena haematopus]|nr:hypothetical protein B0H12DRAFT_334463 [Mycena haematopus]
MHGRCHGEDFVCRDFYHCREKSISTCLFFLFLIFAFGSPTFSSFPCMIRTSCTTVGRFPYAMMIHSCLRWRKVSRVLRLHSIRSRSRNAECGPHTALTPIFYATTTSGAMTVRPPIDVHAH